jgi:hypothetical protein
MVPLDSPLNALAQQGVQAAGNITAAAPTTGNHRASPLVVTDRMMGPKEPKVKQHHRPATTGVWLTMTCVDG